MKLFHVLGLVKESIKLVQKNGKIMASIIMLSLLLPSLLFLLALYFHKFLTKLLDRVIEESLWSDSDYTVLIFFFALLLVAVATTLFLNAVNSSLSITVVILVSAMSYTGEKATMQGLLARMIKSYPRQELSSPRNASRWRNPILILVLIVGASYAYSVTIVDHFLITNAISSVLINITISNSLRYRSVVENLGGVVWVVEEKSEGVTVMEKAEELVVGHQLRTGFHGEHVGVHLPGLACFVGLLDGLVG